MKPTHRLPFPLAGLMMGLVLALSAAPATLASGGGGGDGSVPQGAPGLVLSPEAAATQAYNRALHYRNKAWKIEEKAGMPFDQLDAKSQKKIRGHFERMITALEGAVEKNPNFYQAYSSLGYALRRTGDYPRSLTAYNRSLELNPNYPEAIEYRGEAYLALDRPNDARDAYFKLQLLDAEKAAELLDAFEGWVEKRSEAPGTLPGDEIATISEWVAGQRKIAAVVGRNALSDRDASW